MFTRRRTRLIPAHYPSARLFGGGSFCVLGPLSVNKREVRNVYLAPMAWLLANVCGVPWVIAIAVVLIVWVAYATKYRR